MIVAAVVGRPSERVLEEVSEVQRFAKVLEKKHSPEAGHATCIEGYYVPPIWTQEGKLEFSWSFQRVIEDYCALMRSLDDGAKC